MFRYLSNPRFQWFFDTPNECAAILAMCVMILAGVFLFFSKKSAEENSPSKKWFVASVLSFSLYFFCLYWLLKTYSRGGYVALVVALLVLGLLTQQKKVLALLASFFFLLVLLPDGTRRTIGIIANSADASVGHRLEVWKGAFAMSVDYWQSGVGFEFGGPFIGTYSAWYQPLWLKPSYNSAICDYLSLSARGGIFVLFAYLAVIFTILFAGYLLYRKNKSALLAGLLTAQIAYLISAIFSTFYSENYMFYSFFFLQGLTLLIVIVVMIKRRKLCALRRCVIGIVIPVSTAAVLCIFLLLLGVYFRSQMSTRSRFQNSGNFKIVVVTPQKIKQKGVILYLFDSREISLEKEARMTLRPLAKKGFIVLSAKTQGGFKGLEDAKKLLDFSAEFAKEKNLPLMLAGQGEGGRFAVICATSKFVDQAILKAVAIINSSASYPFPKLSPEEQMKNLKTPLFVIYGENYSLFPSEENLFRDLAKKYNISFQSLIIPDEYYSLKVKRKNALKAISDFFLKLNH